MPVAPSISETDIIAGAIIVGIIVLMGEVLGYSLIDVFKRNPTTKLVSGIERIFVKPERAMIIDTGGGINASVEYGDIKDATANWIVDFHAITILDHLDWNKPIKKGELILNDDAPRQLIGSTSVFLKYVPGGMNNLVQKKIEDYENLFRWYDGQLGNLEAMLAQFSMSEEAKLKISEGIEAIKNRQRFRKQSVEGLGLPGSMGSAGIMSGPIGGT